MNSSKSTLPEDKREQLRALHQRHNKLLAMLPTDVDDLADLDDDQLNAALANIEMIVAEMQAVEAAELAILEELTP